MKKQFSFWTVVLSCLVSVAITAALVTFLFQRKYADVLGSDSAMKLAAVVHAVDAYYIGEADMETATDAAACALVENAADRWSYYMTAEEYASYRDYSNNRYAGIGVTIADDGTAGGLLVTAVTAASPAEKAGIVAGDIIVSVDGEDTGGLTTSDVRARIQAKYGGMVRLGLLHADGTAETVDVSCEYIYSEPVTYKMLDGNTGYISIANFESGSASGAQAAAETLLSEGAEHLVFDVRGNPGGKLDELLCLLDFLLPEGELFVSVGLDGRETVYTSDAACVEIPMAVLLNGDSYSAAEFFAAALSEYGAAVTVGEPSTGKGCSQITLELSDGSAVHISSAKYLTPNRVDLSEQGGLIPDVEAALPEEDIGRLASGQLQPEEDAQLQAAVDFLRRNTSNKSA